VPNLKIEIVLLGMLALLWDSSYLFIKIAVQEIPPITLIAAIVSGAAVFLLLVAKLHKISLPTEVRMWRMLSVQAFFTSIGAWLVLAWGQQYVDSGLASVLNQPPLSSYLF
jgi:drug/metabolite transporter (DMT)-like permease